MDIILDQCLHLLDPSAHGEIIWMFFCWTSLTAETFLLEPCWFVNLT
jgi:hypothetical protein